MGLRYDLTLPLSRFYAANKTALQFPFKVIQTDRVFRAERPQKGRLREFVQCDIDILGDSSCNAEVELIDITARAMLNIGFSDFTININDRRVLKDMLENMGFQKECIDSVCITFDKLDKIGVDGVKKELLEKQFASSAVENLVEFISGGITLDSVSKKCSDSSVADDLKYVISTAEKVSEGKYKISYAPNLVRGQGYYTGMVFEISCPDFSGAIGGGGRYDNMIGKFSGEKVPAVGFSIGFERICSILLERNYKIPSQKEKCALLYEENISFPEVLKFAETLREKYIVSVLKKAKKAGPQFAMLVNQGDTQFAQIKEGNLVLKHS